jgi:hypothetical protein
VELSHIPIYDHHAHALFREEVWRSAPLEPYFSEAYDPQVLSRFVRDNLFFRRSLRDLAGFYGCEPSVQAVQAARQGWNYAELARRMFAQANISQWLIDDGIWPDQLMGVEESGALAGVPVRRILRLETELAKLVPHHDSFSSLEKAFVDLLYEAAPTLAGFKSIIAYRSGLNIRPLWFDVSRNYSGLKEGLKPGEIPKITNQIVLDTALWKALEVAAEVGLPVQFHTGYGDPDLDLRLANPLHLRSVLEEPRFKGLEVVLLHCYPFVREAGYLASVYPGAYLDVGLTIPYTSVHGMKSALHEALHLAPVSKVLFSTDAQRTPELFWLAAKWSRRVLADVLEATVQGGDLSESEAEWAAERILHANAAELYPSS